MKQENKIWALIKPVVVLVLISAIITAALSTTSVITAPVIAAQMAAAEEAAKQEVLPQGSNFAPVEDLTGMPKAIVAAEIAGNGAGYVFTTETKGFGGTVRAMLGVSAEGAITGSKVIEHTETQGIGSKVTENGSPYQQQLVGITKETTGSIEATSGASFSSSAMKQAVIAALDAYRMLNAAQSGGNEGSEGSEPALPLYEADPPANLTDARLAEYYGSAVFADVSGGKVSDAGTVVYASGFGAYGDIMVAVLFDTNDQIIGLIVDASEDTPDIGGKCEDRSYTDLYIGATSGKDVDVLSGASFTSWAIQDAVDVALANLHLVKAAASTGGSSAPAPAPYYGPDAPSNLTDERLAEYYGNVQFKDVPGGKVSEAGTVVYGSGFGAYGDILVAVLFNSNNQIIGLIVDASEDTPEIGGKCEDRSYTDLYIGATKGSDVDVLSGASFTSWAIQDAVDYALANLNTVKGAG